MSLAGLLASPETQCAAVRIHLWQRLIVWMVMVMRAGIMVMKMISKYTKIIRLWSSVEKTKYSYNDYTYSYSFDMMDPPQ